MTEYKTIIKCDIYMCKHNSACCSQPRKSVKEEGSFCTCDCIKIGIDELNNTIDCLHYEEDYKKLGSSRAAPLRIPLASRVSPWGSGRPGVPAP